MEEIKNKYFFFFFVKHCIIQVLLGDFIWKKALKINHKKDKSKKKKALKNNLNIKICYV